MSDMPIDLGRQTWTLSKDRSVVCLSVPLLRLGGVSAPRKVHVNFNAAAIDQIIERLSVLRTQMLPAPTRN
jgi:hypothetical protein